MVASYSNFRFPYSFLMLLAVTGGISLQGPVPVPVTSDVPNRPNIKYSFTVPPSCPDEIYVNRPPPANDFFIPGIPGVNFPVGNFPVDAAQNPAAALDDVIADFLI
ncbi:hypothetical protein V6N12_056317 [Hibiscus sabdariffa]|uniref:Uncharacterized protein n=1 Tax=Hibiscus sabdariffa TaxID=183260 RepID=A0ABR2CS59_9ROSI